MSKTYTTADLEMTIRIIQHKTLILVAIEGLKKEDGR